MRPDARLDFITPPSHPSSRTGLRRWVLQAYRWPSTRIRKTILAVQMASCPCLLGDALDLLLIAAREYLASLKKMRIRTRRTCIIIRCIWKIVQIATVVQNLAKSIQKLEICSVQINLYHFSNIPIIGVCITILLKYASFPYFASPAAGYFASRTVVRNQQNRIELEMRNQPP